MKTTILFALLCATQAAPEDAPLPLPPREAPLRMTLPPGFKATLFAGEPDVVQPIAMCFDQRGRLWVAECYSYPNWHKDLTKGKDRILIFEDTKGAGSFDKRTVFADKLANVSGLQIGFGGAYVCATPNVLFIPDKNGDDVPDGPPEIILDGFSIDARHNVMSSLTWGPDGWLYGCHGIVTTVKVATPGTQRTAMNCGVWRYHPTRKTFEVVAHGTTNPWGLDFDQYGEMFITNCVIGHLWHVVPGAHFERMYGQDLNPSAYGLMKMCADHIHWGGGHWTSSRGGKAEHSDAGGGHAHVGCMIYLGESFPASYRGSVFMCNLHGNRINQDILERKGSTYVARHGKDFMHANDPWFRGLALCYGPDGAVYVSDWTDTGECHNYKVADQKNGRIYKISYDQARHSPQRHYRLNSSTRSYLEMDWRVVKRDLAKYSDSELVMLHRLDNEWFVRQARRQLQERAARRAVAPEAIDDLWNIFALTEGDMQLKGLWSLYVINQLKEEKLIELLEHHNEYVRAWAVRFLTEDRQLNAARFMALRGVAKNDCSGLVRAHLAGSMQFLEYGKRASWGEALVEELVARNQDADDPYLPLLYWYAAAPHCHARMLPRVRIPLVREYMARHVTRSSNLDDVLEGIKHIDDPVAMRDILRGIQESLKGQRALSLRPVWAAIYPQLVESPLLEVRERALALAAQFDDARALDTLQSIVVDRKEAGARRQAALGTLVFRQNDRLIPVLQDLLNDADMRSPALKGLAAFEDPKAPELILKRYAVFNDGEKADAVHTLSSRASYARALLDALEKKQVPIQDVSAFNARQIQALGNKEITDKLTNVWGAIRPAAESKAPLLAKYKTVMTPANLKKANLARGRLLYQKTCAACHRLFDDGGNIGPELTGSQRLNLDYVLENMLDPSAIVAKDYQVTILTTTGGRVLTGIIKQETDKAVTVQTQNELLVVPLGDIDSRVRSSLSMMPEGQLDPLQMDEVRDLIAYLASPLQVPLPTK